MDNIATKYRSFWVCLALTLVTAAVFCQVCAYDFTNYDDGGYVYENFSIQGGFTPEAVKWAFTTGHNCNWHPLTWLSHILDWQLFGPKAGGHHLVNLIFHIANTLLLFIVLKEMTRGFWQSAFVAVLFALHPLHVESVAWVAERKDVLSTFFWMLTMLAYVRYVKQPSAARYLLTLPALALGLMSKPMLVTLPFVLLLLDYWPLARVSFERRVLCHLIREKIPFFILSAVSSAVTFFVQRSGGAVAGLVYLPLKTRILNTIFSYAEYIRKMVWPARLAVFYPYPDQNRLILYAVISAILLLAVTILVFRSAKTHRYLFTGWFWYLGTLVPVIGLVQVGMQAMADRYTYITLTGLFIIIAWGVPDLLTKWRYKKTALALSALAVITTLSVRTYFQVRHWRDSLTLFQHAIDATGDNYTARLHLALSLLEQNRIDKAIKMYQKHLWEVPDSIEALNNLGIALGKQGKFDESVEHFEKALQIKPDYVSAHTNLSYVLLSQGKFDEAILHLTEAIRLSPLSVRAHYYLGQALTQKGRVGEAIKHFEEAIRLKPDWAEPMNDIAWFMTVSKETKVRNPERAIRLAEKACKLSDYKKPEFLDTLAAAYAAAGDFEKAIGTAERALELCQSPEQNPLKEEIESRLALYKAGKPYIEAQ
ncbi:MAG: tetratricopeptide repeat protein [Sedimentisphaerales bacterium]|nr:tetratricopeptide repeat protein [Sedimentisphaerales bacterium]